jgi:hypothetical protein
MATVKEHVRKFKAAHRLASDIMASAHAGLPDENHIHNLATAIYAHNITATDGQPQPSKHAGRDADQENMLRDSYRVEGQNQQSDN